MKKIVILGLALACLLTFAPGIARAQGVGQTHVVRRGENLFRIALRYGVSVQALASINGIANPTMIYVGQTLVIPAYGKPAGAPKPTGTPVPPTSTPTPEPTATIADAATEVQPTAAVTEASIAALPTSTPMPPTSTPAPEPTATIAETGSLPQPTATITDTATEAQPIAAVTEASIAALPTSTPALPTSMPEPQATTHVVAAGENLFRIALRYGLTTAQLAAANGIANYGRVYVGQVLRIPVPGQAIAAPAPSAPSAFVSYSFKKVVVSISRQHLWAYSGDQVVFSFVASTGLSSSPTAPGSYRVLDKIPNAYASTWNLQMPYWLGIYYVGRIENGIHALPILANGQTLWGGLLGRPASFGCVILDTASAKQLYDWVDVGTPVIIQP